MLNRRRFVQSLIVAAASPAISASCRSEDPRLVALQPDPQQLLDLPDGFSYNIVSRAGDIMNDGLKVPPAHDGMAAFAGVDGRIILICNHEMDSGYPEYSAFGTTFASQPEAIKARVYDLGGGVTPGAGGTTTTVYNPATGKPERQHLSLAGTELNCAGGATPWGSWLSCEECFESPGTAFGFGRKTVRDEPHGYVFEVPANETGLAEPIALKAMGRFEHEAAAVHARIKKLLMEAGADSVETEGEVFEVTGPSSQFQIISEALEAANLKPNLAQISYVAKQSTSASFETCQKILALMDKIEDQSDVINVYNDLALTDELMEKLQAT